MHAISQNWDFPYGAVGNSLRTDSRPLPALIKYSTPRYAIRGVLEYGYLMRGEFPWLSEDQKRILNERFKPLQPPRSEHAIDRAMVD